MPDPTPPRPSFATLLRQPDRSHTGTDAAATSEPGAVAHVPAHGAPTHQTEPDTADTTADMPEAITDAVARTRETATSAAPNFLKRPVLRSRPWQWIALLGLSALLALQILIADRQQLSADAHWRPWVSGICEVLHCSVPAWREPRAFTMLSREVRPLPGKDGVLLVRATFRNDARWAQAWPLLQLSLADADGRTIGSRVLKPQDYLGNHHPDNTTLAPGQSAQITFQVRELAADTAAFSFDFH
ncbi:DUF3426 domain-containing protein [Xanthomonas sp. MUS 060]|uniref:DUF3426 domain-containing protein n=1 Tax=Xanthomonas sp. MUS 060 TaxID=1588031 RepID=UPI000B1A2F19|nr:DUF3426 domain-containing protein [Xanthomonas sp. MUS 060]